MVMVEMLMTVTLEVVAVTMVLTTMTMVCRAMITLATAGPGERVQGQHEDGKAKGRKIL